MAKTGSRKSSSTDLLRHMRTHPYTEHTHSFACARTLALYHPDPSTKLPDRGRPDPWPAQGLGPPSDLSLPDAEYSLASRLRVQVKGSFPAQNHTSSGSLRKWPSLCSVLLPVPCSATCRKEKSLDHHCSEAPRSSLILFVVGTGSDVAYPASNSSCT